MTAIAADNGFAALMDNEKFLDICLNIISRLEDADFNNGKMYSGIVYSQRGKGQNTLEDMDQFIESGYGPEFNNNFNIKRVVIH